jgi:hypothetical protein
VTMEQVGGQPTELVNSFFMRNAGPGVAGPRDPFAVPEREDGYPEPSMFGLLPAGGIYARHVRGLTIHNFTLSFMNADQRPVVVLEDVAGSSFEQFRTVRTAGRPVFMLRKVQDFQAHRCANLPDVSHDAAENVSL